jgi:hypothetical protein
MGFRVGRRRLQSLAGDRMTTSTKDAITVTVLMLLGLAFIGDLHRTFLAWAWPIITDYLDWLVK